MSAHKYGFRGKSSNCPFALVRGVVFLSVSDAKEYCRREGLDADVWVRTGDLDTLTECEHIARVALPVLREIREHFSEQFDNSIAASHSEMEKVVALEHSCDVLDEARYQVKRESWIRGTGRVNGLYDGLVILYRYIDTLEKVLRYRATR